MKLLKVMLSVGIVGCLINLHAEQQSEIGNQDDVVAQVTESSSQEVTQKIQMFIYRDCPYCIKVYLFLYSQNLLEYVEFVDVESSENQELLKKVSGATQVPYILDVDANVKMAESDDIIQYFVNKYNITFVTPASVVLQSQEGNTQQAYNPATFVSDVQALKRPVIILVSTTWCPPCKVFKPIFLEIAEQMGDVCEFICLDGDVNLLIVQQLGVECFPSIVCFKNGEQINPENYRNKEGLVQLVQSLV